MFFFKQKTAYVMRISDWSSDVCSSDLSPRARTLLVLGYEDVYCAGDHVPEILKHQPVGLEGIDGLLVDYMKRKNLHPRNRALLPQGGGWLLVEFGGADKREAAARAMKRMDQLRDERSEGRRVGKEGVKK